MSMGDESSSTRVDVMNAQALAANLADLRLRYEARFVALENKLAAVETLMQNQERVLGEALQMAYGRGSTVPDPEG